MLFLYLDIDGVAIPDRQADQSITFAMSNRLRRILDSTGAKLVISSHRRISNLTVFNLLSAAGFTPHDFADDSCTPFLLSPSPNTSVRGQEIAQHLVHHRSEEHTSDLHSLMRSSYTVFCLNKNSNNLTQ